jgi:hypothetical protein
MTTFGVSGGAACAARPALAGAGRPLRPPPRPRPPAPRGAGARRALLDHGDADALALEIDGEDLEATLGARSRELLPSVGGARGRERRDVRETLDAGLQLDERAEILGAHDLPFTTLPMG